MKNLKKKELIEIIESKDKICQELLQDIYDIIDGKFITKQKYIYLRSLSKDMESAIWFGCATIK